MALPVSVTLAQMAAAVRKGDFAEARRIGSSSDVCLAVEPSQLQVKDVISSGSEGTIHHGTYAGKQVAVKKPRISNTADLERFRKEVALMCEMQHPAILPVIAAVALPPAYALVLPYYPCDMYSEIHAHGWRPSIPHVVDIALQLAEAMVHVHSKGVLHRDIKPGNILLTQDRSRIALTDFGISVRTNEVDADVTKRATTAIGRHPSGGFHKTHMVGTLEYMAPEVLQRHPHSKLSDVYAFAVTVNELATGVFPFSDCTRENPKAHTILEMGYGRQELAAAVCVEGLRPITTDHMPQPLVQLLSNCWSLATHERPSFQQIASELRAMKEQLVPVSLANGYAASNGHTADANGHMTASQATSESSGHSTPAASVVNGVAASQPAGNGVAVQGAAEASRAAISQWDRPSWEDEIMCSGYIPQVHAGGYASAGRRGDDKMEDRHVVSTKLGAVPHAHVLAVFDGHRGYEAAEFAKTNLQTYLTRCLTTCTPDEALSRAFVNMDEDFLAEQEAAWREHVLSMHGAAGKRRWAGCTALAVFLWKDWMYAANAGDCRAVLCRKGEAIAITTDHTANMDSERSRVVAAGGKVRWQVDGWRVGDAGIQITRSLGDGDMKSSGVTARPELSVLQLSADDEFVIIASDGMWDKVSVAEAVHLVHDTVKQPEMAAQRLVTEALARGSEDNITAIVAFLKPMDTLETIFTSGRQKYGHVAATHFGTRKPGRITDYANSGSRDECQDTY